MVAEENKTLIVHVLAIDLVRFSTHPNEVQVRKLGKLSMIIQECEAVRGVGERDEVEVLPTGDGAILLFLTDPAATIRCADQISAALDACDYLPYRMGVHSGPVTRVTDPAGRPNFTGNGINLAERVMRSARVNQITVSASTFHLLHQTGEWNDRFVCLGRRKDKNGKPLIIYALCPPSGGYFSRHSWRLLARLAAPFKWIRTSILVAAGCFYLLYVPYFTILNRLGPNRSQAFVGGATSEHPTISEIEKLWDARDRARDRVELRRALGQ